MDVESAPQGGTWWRQIPAGADVHYEPPDPADNRWQRGSIVEGLYLADSEETMWAEWYRWLAEAALPPKYGLPRDVWQWKVSLPDVADLSNDARLARVGLPPLQPTRLQWPVFQAVREQLHADGWPALLAPSSAHRGGLVLCVFRTTRVVSGTRPLPPPTSVDEPPVVPVGLRT